jgi:methionyl-tRNA formyltransferase
VVAYRILPPEVFKMPLLGAINIHASLLPKFRGPAPIQRTIEKGEKETGITVFQINRGIDTGNIIMQEKVPIEDTETSPQLYERLSRIGAETCIHACRFLEEGKVNYQAQDDRFSTPAPKLTKAEALIDWALPASVLFNKIRAFKPFPGTYTLRNGKRLQIEWALPVEGGSDDAYGTVCTVSSEWFEVQCGKNLLRIFEVKPEGKKQMPVSAFLNGANIEKGMRLG